MITIIDYGLGNLGSVKNMLKKIGVESEISKELMDINIKVKRNLSLQRRESIYRQTSKAKYQATK